MAERRSSLAAIAPIAAPAAPVTLSEVRPGALLHVIAWPDTLPAVENALLAVSGSPPPSPGNGQASAGISIAAVSPGRYFVQSQSDDLVARLRESISPEDGSVTDVSHGYVVVRIEGEAAADLLLRCIALDLDETVFPAGRVARTHVHHVDVVVHRVSATAFDLLVSRSFAESLVEWILDAGVEFPIAFDDAGSSQLPASQTDAPPA